jgi:hypothetical protein
MDTTTNTTVDLVNQPSHYTGYPLEPIKFIMLNDLPYYKGNVVKYVSRAGLKFYPDMDEVESEIVDLRKAIKHCELRIKQLQGEAFP